MLTERDLHSLKCNCGNDVYSIRPWSGEHYGKEDRYYINLVDIHCLFTNEDKTARIWFTENNPALQVDLKGKPSRHWVQTVARIHRIIEAWFKVRRAAPRKMHKQEIKSASQEGASENLGDKNGQERIPVLEELALPSDWFSSLDGPDERLKALQRAREITESPCLFALFSNGRFYFAENLESLVEKISKGSGHVISRFERKERFLTCAYRCEKMPRKKIEELRQAFESASKQFDEKEKKHHVGIPQTQSLGLFICFFEASLSLRFMTQ